MKSLLSKIPEEVTHVTKTLENAGFEAYFVGGCVRDLIIGREPKDWDITTNATPEQIISLFEETFYENNYGTVGVVNKGVCHETLKVIEVTPYRLESFYSDFRRPDSVTFSSKIEDDLKRRDFTINALALNNKGLLIDLYKGQNDIETQVVRTVGDPNERFAEDALRMLRAVRIHAELGFMISHETQQAIQKNANLLEKIARERIRDEFTRIILSSHPAEALEMTHRLGILKYIIPELEKGIGIDQNKAHAFDVWTHLLKSLQHSADKSYPLHVRLTALFHDISKPETRRKGENDEWTFYGHEVVGSRVTEKILKNLKFSKEMTDLVTNLVRWHMFFSDTEQITHSAVRRIIAKVGKDHIWDLMNVRICDRIGTGRPKENPYRLRKYKSMVEEVLSDPISVNMLKIDGNILIKELGIQPGRRMGYLLHALLEEVLENPKLNTLDYLKNKSMELNKLSDIELETLGEKGRETKDNLKERKTEEIRKKHHVE